MTHIQLPLKDANEGAHITLVHFSRHLNDEEGAIAVEGMEALVEVYGPHMYDMFYGEKMYFGPPWAKVLGCTVEFGTNAVPDLRQRLFAGLKGRGLPVSEDYGPGWEAHVTKFPYDVTPWRPIHYHRELRLIQGPHVIPVPIPDPNPEF